MSICVSSALGALCSRKGQMVSRAGDGQWLLEGWPGQQPPPEALPPSKDDFQADGLPQLVGKCELKPSPWCIINGKIEEIHTFFFFVVVNTVFTFPMQCPPKRAVRDWNDMVGKGL